MNIGFWGYYTFRGSHGDVLTRPATVVQSWPKEFGDEDGYNVLVFVDGTNDAPGGDNFVKWATSVRLTEYATLDCLSRRPDRSPEDIEAERVEVIRRAKEAEEAETRRIEEERVRADEETAAAQRAEIAKKLQDQAASEPAEPPAKPSKKTSSSS